jgi:hypothetical protein
MTAGGRSKPTKLATMRDRFCSGTALLRPALAWGVSLDSHVSSRSPGP